MYIVYISTLSAPLFDNVQNQLIKGSHIYHNKLGKKWKITQSKQKSYILLIVNKAYWKLF